MLIAFEGPDGSGKSTLAKRVQKRLDALLVHCGPPPRGSANYVWERLIQNLPNTRCPVVCDRLHWGEYPYGEIYRRSSELGKDGVLAIDKLFERAGGVMVYVTADPDILAQRLNGRGDDYVNTADLPQIVKMYDELYEQSPCAKFRINTTHGFAQTGEWMIDRILDRAEREWFGW